MKGRKSARQRAIVRRNVFLSCCAAVLLAVVAFVAVAVNGIISNEKEQDKPNISASLDTPVSSDVSSDDTPSYPDIGPNGLDANYSQLLLVNKDNPLPEDYDYEGNLTTIPAKYLKGSLNQIDKDVWPYMQAMLDAAASDGVDLRVWSPYRSYNTQKWLFSNETKKWKDTGLSDEEAEIKAATVVTRPGTSEHNTGFCADLNCADDSFERMPAFSWMHENAAEYGFILRFPNDKQDITGIIYESWHYRFVGINNAKEMKRLNMCLEEYVEYLEEK